MNSAKVIAHSINPAGEEIITMQLEYPRFIHADFMTHRVFSRNAASSRAVPIAKMINRVMETPAMPVHWGENQPGMQADREIAEQDKSVAKDIWLDARDVAVERVKLLMEYGVHKQVANRLLEPWVHMQTVVTSTEWENFFELRNHKDAQPEIQALAAAMLEAMGDSTPTKLEYGEWHLPYATESECDSLSLEKLLRVSTARCARVSYFLQDGKGPSLEKDLMLHDRLVKAKPVHASPAEHQAVAKPGNHNNFNGWKPYRLFLDSNEVLP